jgi:hypothetical protein
MFSFSTQKNEIEEQNRIQKKELNYDTMLRVLADLLCDDSDLSTASASDIFLSVTSFLSWVCGTRSIT